MTTENKDKKIASNCFLALGRPFLQFNQYPHISAETLRKEFSEVVTTLNTAEVTDSQRGTLELILREIRAHVKRERPRVLKPRLAYKA